MPEFLRALLPLETPRQQQACRRHDERYSIGGTRRQRLIDDLLFALDLLGADPNTLDLLRRWCIENIDPYAMEPDRAEQYFFGVRSWGGIFWLGGDMPGAPLPAPPEIIESP